MWGSVFCILFVIIEFSGWEVKVVLDTTDTYSVFIAMTFSNAILYEYFEIISAPAVLLESNQP